MALSNGPKLGLLVDGLQGELHYEELMYRWRALDSLIQATVISRTFTTPPGSPSDGDTYVIATGATGAWATHDQKITRYSTKQTAWEFYTPKNGWAVYSVADSKVYRYNGTSWGEAPSGDMTLSGTQEVTGVKRTQEVTDNDGSFDLNAALDFVCTPSGAVTLTFTNIPASPAVQKGTVILVNPSGYTVTAHTNTKVESGTLALISGAGTYELAYRTSNGVSYVTASGAMS